jgi:hypothetical protein
MSNEHLCNSHQIPKVCGLKSKRQHNALLPTVHCTVFCAIILPVLPSGPGEVGTGEGSRYFDSFFTKAINFKKSFLKT